MGLSASQGRLLLLTARQNDLEYQAQQISHQRLAIASKLDEISQDFENATSNKQMIFRMQDSDGTSVATNLTYAKLVSGAASLGSSSGLNQVEGINTSDYSNSQAFRLTDGTSIVVSDISEIPGTKSTNTNAGEPAYDSTNKIYTQNETEQPGGNSPVKTTQTKYFAIENLGATSDLAKAVNGNDISANSCEMFKNGNTLYIKYNGEYYNLSGAKQTLDETVIENLSEYTYSNGTTDENAKVKFVCKKNQVPKNVNITYQQVKSEQLTNGRITVNGISYLVDESLKDNGSGINYLQNCLRNGKYTLEKLNINNDNTEKKWRQVTWDSMASISDINYEDDDSAAKAKYERLKNQVEIQDKKLQLDLDNIETQRNAVKTEIDSVEKVIKDNIEKTFNTFG